MKPMQLNMKNLKKIKEDANSSTFMHPQGHTMTIAHGPLPTIQRKQLQMMPLHKYAEGGEAQSDQTPVNTDYASINIPENVKNLDQNMPVGMSQNSTQQGLSQDVQESTPVNKNPNTQENVVPAAQAETPPQNMVENAYNQGVEAYKQQAKVAGDLSQQQAKIESDHIKEQDALNERFKSNYKTLQDHQDAILKDYGDGHINENHYLQSLSTGQKVVGAIALMLGGLGQGLNKGQGNPAEQFINAQINRDIEAQKSTKDNQKTLLNANMQMFHDTQLAEQQTRINLNDIYAHKIAQKAAELGTPQAQANAATGIANLNLSTAQVRSEMARKMTALDAIKNGNASPEAVVPYIVPEAHQKDALKEIGQAKQAATNHDYLMQQFDKAAQENTNLQTGFGKLRTPPSIQAMNGLELPMIHDQEGRVNEFEQHTLQQLHPQPGDLDSKIAQKRIAYEKFITNKTQTPTVDAYAPGLMNKYRTQSAPVNPMEGKTGTLNGQRVIMRNGKITPYNG